MSTTPPPDRPGHGVPDRSSADRLSSGPPAPVPAGGAAADTAQRGGIDLGVAQVVASALAAVTSAVAASTLGVAGTIVGAGVGAVVATVGSAVYAHSLRRAGARLRELRPPDDGRWPAPRPTRPTSSGGTAEEPAQPSAAAAPGAAVPVDVAAAEEPAGRRSWRRGAVVVAVGFVLALAGITGAEAVLGHPLSSSKESGTSVGRAVTGGSGGARTPATTPSSSTPSSTESSSTTSEPATSPSSPTTTGSVPEVTTSVPSATASPGLSAPSAPSESTTSPAEPTTSSSSAPQESAPASSAPVAPTSPSGQ